MKRFVYDKEVEFSENLFSSGEHWDKVALVEQKCLAINRTKGTEMCMIVATPSLSKFLGLGFYVSQATTSEIHTT